MFYTWGVTSQVQSVMNNQAPNHNMRRLKRVMSETGLIYTLETDSERAKDNLLCNYCAAKLPALGDTGCKIYGDLFKMSERGVIPMIRACHSYQPIISFRPRLIGFSGRFNTFRIGNAWYQRLMPGVVVGLMNTQNSEVFARAVVERIEVGSFSQMCKEHASNNHMLLGMEPVAAGKKMEEILRQMYGRILQDNQDRLETTVIYMRNVLFEEHAEDHQHRAASG